MLNQDPKESIPMLVDTLNEDDLVIVIESLHFLEKACKAASECQNGFAVYEEMVKSLPLFNALVTVTYKAYEGTFKTFKIKTIEWGVFKIDTLWMPFIFCKVAIKNC